MTERLKRIQQAVETAAGGKALHVHSKPVREVFRGKVVWEGVVEIFSLLDHPKAPRCHAWSYQDDAGETQFVTVLELPPVSDPQTAVKVYVASLAR